MGYPGYWGAWGLGAWTLGSWYYNTGYATYSNPYYEAPSTTVVVESPTYDYSQPIDVSSQQAATPSDEGMQQFDAAKDAFRARDYPGALRAVEQAISMMPDDAALHEFRALVLFALKRYREAAATLYAVLSVGPGWDWTTLSGLYPSMDVYTGQLRALEGYQREHPDSADAHFVLAYHYLTAGHTDAAAEQLEEVVRLNPEDKLSAQLVTLVSPEQGADVPPSADAAATSPPAKQGNPVGVWTAKPAADATIELSLCDDGTFTWRFTDSRRTHELEGTFELAGSVLVLQPADSEAMVGNVTWNGEQEFEFKLIGGPPNDSGLRFNRR